MPEFDDQNLEQEDDLALDQNEELAAAKQIAAANGYKWNGLFSEDEGEKVYSAVNKDEEDATLYLSVGASGLSWYFEENSDEGQGEESLKEYFESGGGSPERREQVAEEKWQKDQVNFWTQRMETWLKGRGRADFQEAIADEGAEGGAEFITDHVYYSSVPQDYRQPVIDNLKNLFQKELAQPKQERTVAPNVAITALTPEEQQEIIQAAQSTWDQIGMDALTATKQSGGPSTLRGDTVAEIAFDADRPVTIGGISRELYKKFLGMPEDQKDTLMNKAFPFSERFGI
jgi:hypothetical protein